MSKPKTTNDVVATREVLMTNDYSMFKTMEGNREVDDHHVKQLQKLMLQNGNLTAEFPIIVGKDGVIIDGQHRFKALEGLGWDVGYMVEENATIDTVRAINRGNRNWSWRDIAYSYANLGDENYKWFISFTDQYGLRLSPALMILGGVADRSRGQMAQAFRSGTLAIPDKAKAHDIAQQVIEIERLVQIYGNDFASALVTIMAAPAYDQERMMNKLRQQGELLPAKAKKSDYMRHLEDMYNFGFPEENRARLF